MGQHLPGLIHSLEELHFCLGWVFGWFWLGLKHWIYSFLGKMPPMVFCPITTGFGGRRSSFIIHPLQSEAVVYLDNGLT